MNNQPYNVVDLHREIWQDILYLTCERIAHSPRAAAVLVGHGRMKMTVLVCPCSWIMRSWILVRLFARQAQTEHRCKHQSTEVMRHHKMSA